MSEETEEYTSAEISLGKREYNVILARLNQIEGHCIRAADSALAAHQIAHTAMWMKASWAPYIISGLAFAMAFAACVSR